MRSCLGLRRFIVSAIRTISMRPSRDKCSPAAMRFSDPNDLDETVAGQMLAGRNALYAHGELLEVLLLRGPHGISPEEWNDPLQEILTPTDDVSVQVFSVGVVAPVRHYLTHTEVLNELMEAPDARSALSHRKLMSNLIAGSVADSALPIWLPDEAD